MDTSHASTHRCSYKDMMHTNSYGLVRGLQEAARRAAGATFSLDIPTGSALWTRAPLRRALRSTGACAVLLDQCQYGTPCKKPTRMHTATQAIKEVVKAQRTARSDLIRQPTFWWC